jgi:hypothetical protein
LATELAGTIRVGTLDGIEATVGRVVVAVDIESLLLEVELCVVVPEVVVCATMSHVCEGVYASSVLVLTVVLHDSVDEEMLNVWTCEPVFVGVPEKETSVATSVSTEEDVDVEVVCAPASTVLPSVMAEDDGAVVPSPVLDVANVELDSAVVNVEAVPSCEVAVSSEVEDAKADDRLAGLDVVGRADPLDPVGASEVDSV